MARVSFSLLCSLLLALGICVLESTASPVEGGNATVDRKTAVLNELQGVLRRAASGQDFPQKDDASSGVETPSSLKCLDGAVAPWIEGFHFIPDGALENPAICVTLRLKVNIDGENFVVASRFGAPKNAPVMRAALKKNPEVAPSTCFDTPSRGSPLFVAVNGPTFSAVTTQVCGCSSDYCNMKI